MCRKTSTSVLAAAVEVILIWLLFATVTPTLAIPGLCPQVRAPLLSLP
jgi:hypothetical protein